MLAVIKDALKATFTRPITWLALIAVPLIVMLFGLLYVDTYVDPHERMKDMPVALINEDEGATVDGKHKNFGNELVESILENDDVRWVEEDASLLADGIENTDYYVAVVIPADFSDRVAAGQTKEPEQAHVTFIKDVRKNYLFSTFADNIERNLGVTLNEKIGAQYTEALADGLIDAQDGFRDGADGASELQSGLESAQNGGNQLEEGLASLADGTTSLADGTTSLADGLATLNDSSTALTDGSSQLGAGASQLAAGTSALSSAIDGALSSLASGYGGNPANSISALKANYAQELEDYTVAVAQATAAGKSPASVDPSGLNAAVEALAQASQAAGSYGALAEVQDGAAQVDAGADQLVAAQQQLDQGIGAYTDAVATLADGAQAADAGAARLQSGSAALTSGLSAATEGAGSLADGLSDGADAIGESLTTDPETLGSYATDPIEVEEAVHGDLSSFGYGFAPLFMSLSLWLGTLMIFFVISPFPSPAQKDAGRVAAIIGRWPAYLVFAAIEAVALSIGAVAIDVPIVDGGLFCLVIACITFSFLCIMQFLNLFDIVGKALSILLVALQLVFCSGVFPAELGTDLAVAVGPYLPFYYAIDALREVMSGTQPALAYHDMAVLLAFAVGAVILSLACYPAAKKMKQKRDREAIVSMTGKWDFHAIARAAHAQHGAQQSAESTTRGSASPNATGSVTATVPNGHSA